MTETQFIRERTPQALAEHIQPIARPEFDVLNRLPYNRFAPEESTWWLVPSHKSPAHANTKFFFAYQDAERRNISIGVQGEKGLSPALRELYPGKKGAHLIMDTEWQWPRLCSYLVSAQFEAALMKAGANMTQPIHLEIYIGYVQDIIEFDPYSPLRERDSFHYAFDTARRTWVEHRAPHIVHDVLQGFGYELDAHTLSRQLQVLGANNWLWVDLYVTSSFTIADQTGDADALWSPRRIWNDYLHYLAFVVQ